MEFLKTENLCKVYGKGETKLPLLTMCHLPSKRESLPQL